LTLFGRRSLGTKVIIRFRPSFLAGRRRGHPMFDRIKTWVTTWARALKRDAYAVYLAARNPNTPWYVKGLAIVVAAYAFSPIDLIPDFIPVLGYLDDLILVPLGIWLVVSLIPEQAMAEYRAKASEATLRPHSNVAAITIIAIWMLGAALLCWFGFLRWSR
jgi:uncharacterized membrane protein YkvA (DUF1232 family)